MLLSLQPRRSLQNTRSSLYQTKSAKNQTIKFGLIECSETCPNLLTSAEYIKLPMRVASYPCELSIRKFVDLAFFRPCCLAYNHVLLCKTPAPHRTKRNLLRRAALSCLSCHFPTSPTRHQLDNQLLHICRRCTHRLFWQHEFKKVDRQTDTQTQTHTHTHTQTFSKQ